MKPVSIIQAWPGVLSPEAVVNRLQDRPGVVLFQSSMLDPQMGRYSLVAARPFLCLRTWATRCELIRNGRRSLQFGNPWRFLESLLARYELLEELDLPFPLGGCFGFWGYDLRHFVEPGLSRRAIRDLDLPDCVLGFYSSLVVLDHRLGKTWILSSGLLPDGSRSRRHAQAERDRWAQILQEADAAGPEALRPLSGQKAPSRNTPAENRPARSNLSQHEFISKVLRAQDYIRAGDIYQVNLSHRLSVDLQGFGWDFYRRLTSVSPAPFSAWLDLGHLQIASSSPELFLRLSGSHVQTRPIKGTRPRDADPTRDAQFSYELQTSPKEMAELIMITDLLRNDLGRVCEYGSVQVPELARLKRYPHVQHLVSTVEGQLRPGMTHDQTLASCFPGGSITGAPKIRAMNIIDELEPVTRGPYTGCVGYLGFNRESQFSILIRAGLCHRGQCFFHVGAGIVADSDPQAEYKETLAKAGGFIGALGRDHALRPQVRP